LTDEDQGKLLENGAALCEVYRRYRNILVVAPGGSDPWKVWSMALLDRCCHSLETILSIADREVDAAILTRSLYEHVVAFAWSAMDPETNLKRLDAWESEQRQKMLTDLKRVGGPEAPLRA
jgi:hypothetical protein